MAHIVVVAVVEAVFEIVVAFCGEGPLYVGEGVGGEAGVDAVNFHLKAEESVLGVVFMAQGFFYGLYACSGRADDGGAFAGLRVAGVGEVGVNEVAVVDAQFDEVAEDAVGAVFCCSLARVLQFCLFESLQLLFPELGEVSGLLCVGLYLFR